MSREITLFLNTSNTKSPVPSVRDRVSQTKATATVQICQPCRRLSGLKKAACWLPRPAAPGNSAACVGFSGMKGQFARQRGNDSDSLPFLSLSCLTLRFVADSFYVIVVAVSVTAAWDRILSCWAEAVPVKPYVLVYRLGQTQTRHAVHRPVQYADPYRRVFVKYAWRVYFGVG